MVAVESLVGIGRIADRLAKNTGPSSVYKLTNALKVKTDFSRTIPSNWQALIGMQGRVVVSRHLCLLLFRTNHGVLYLVPKTMPRLLASGVRVTG